MSAHDPGDLPRRSRSRALVLVALLSTSVLGAPDEATSRVSVSSTGVEPDASGGLPSISANGRFVAFVSAATNLVAGDGNGQSDVFVRSLGGK